MCGIFGWLMPQGAAQKNSPRNVALSLWDALSLRGPDDRGYAIFSQVGSLLGTEKSSDMSKEGESRLLLGQTRLAVIDLSMDGHQPMRSGDGRYTLVYNGEIYNYRELRGELANLGHQFRTATDSEVLLHALMQWETDALVRLNGMFAFALYDSKAQTLLCARDFFGVKPFFWTRTPSGGFAFASELPALLRIPGVARRLNRPAAYAYLTRGQVDAADVTMLDGVFQLMPAHYLRLSISEGAILQMQRYWEVPLPSPLHISFNEAAEELRRLLLDSVRLHLRADVPLGVALSGGVDSSSIACAIRHLEPDMPLHTFTYVADDAPTLCEERWADIAIAHTKAVPHKVRVRSQELLGDIDTLIERQGEPFGSTSIYAQYRVFQSAHENGMVVTLDGQGADEIFGGYVWYRLIRFQTLLERHGSLHALRFLYKARRLPGTDSKTLLELWTERHLPAFVLRCMKRLRHAYSDENSAIATWLHKEMITDAIRNAVIPPVPDWYHSEDKLRACMAAQTTWHGLPNLLRHGDRNSMAFSVESRVPFCNRQLAEFAFSLPEEYLLDNNGLTKSVLRKSMYGIAPTKLLYRKDKIGFATPEFKWFSSNKEWLYSVLKESKYSQVLNYDGIISNLNATMERKLKFDWRIWRWINYLLWIRIFSITE